MPSKARKPRMPDPMQFAIAIVEGVTGETLTDRPKQPSNPLKDPKAVARGAKGGKAGGAKGGKARAATMTPAQRKASAKKAAEARWGKSVVPTHDS